MAGVSGVAVIATEWCMIVLTLLCVWLRFHIRLHIQIRLNITDTLVFIAWISFLTQGIFDTILLKEGFFAETWVVMSELGGKILFIENATYMMCMYCIKFAMLTFYLDLIPRMMKYTRIAIWVTIGVSIVGLIMTILSNLIACRPISSNWSTDPETYCQANDTLFGGVTNVSFHLLTDIMIYCIPFSVVRVLQLPRRQKIGVGVTFGLGFLCIVFAVFVFAGEYILQNPGFVWLMCVFEQTWSIIVVCAPAFKAVLLSKQRLSTRLSKKVLSSYIETAGENRRERSQRSGSDFDDVDDLRISKASESHGVEHV